MLINGSLRIKASSYSNMIIRRYATFKSINKAIHCFLAVFSILINPSLIIKSSQLIRRRSVILIIVNSWLQDLEISLVDIILIQSH